MSTPTRIVLVEDHAILRDGLRALIELEPDMQVVGEAASGAEGVRVAQNTHPDLIITDLAMQGGSGLGSIYTLRTACPNVRVMVLTAYCTDEYIRAALGAGAERGADILVRAVGGEHHDAHVRAGGAQRVDRAEARAALHGEIGDDEIGVGVLRHPHTLGAARRLAHDLHVGLELDERAQPIT